MSRKMLTSLDMVKNEIQNAVAQNLAGAPSSPVKGQFYFNSTDNTLYWYDGSGWVAAKGGSGTPTGAAGGDLTGSYPNPTLAANSVGTADIADANVTMAKLAADTKDQADGTSSLRKLGYAASNAMPGPSSLNFIASNVATTGAVNLNGQKLTNLPVIGPWSPSDAVSKAYVDSVAQGLDPKPSMKAATTGNITLSGAQTVDGVALVDGDTCLVKNQTLSQNNGLYWVNGAGAWTRLSEADAWGELVSAYTFVEQGTTQKDTGWTCTVDTGGVLGTTPVTFEQFSGAGTILPGAGLAQSGNTFNVGEGAGINVLADTIEAEFTTAGAMAGTGTQVARGDHAHTANSKIQSFPTAAATSTTVAHNLGTRDVTVQVYRNSSPWDTVECDVERPDTSNVTVRFNVATTAGEHRIVVTG